MRKLAVVLAVVAAGLWPRGGEAVQPRTCAYHSECNRGQLCHRGRCLETQEVLEHFSADETCGEDRRCRIERLKRMNRVRRQSKLLDERRYTRSLADDYHNDEIEEYPRIDKPFTVDWRFSRFGVLGLSAGYTFAGRLRTELQFAHKPIYHLDVTFEDELYSASQPVYWFMPGVVYFFTDARFAPFAGVSFVYGTGSYRGETSPSSSLGEADALETIYHAGEVKAGVDYQLPDEGAHLRLGLSYRPLIYNQARISPGRYAETRRKVLRKWFEQIARIDLIFLAGWAF